MKAAAQYESNIRGTFAAVHKYGVPKSTVANEITTQLYVANPEALENYFLLHHSAEYFIDHSHEGIYTRKNRKGEEEHYVIIYHKCTRLEVRKYRGQVKLSFRSAKPEYNLPAYVMVAI